MYILCINRITTRFIDVTKFVPFLSHRGQNVTKFLSIVKTLGITAFLRGRKNAKFVTFSWNFVTFYQKFVTFVILYIIYSILCIIIQEFVTNYHEFCHNLRWICPICHIFAVDVTKFLTHVTKYVTNWFRCDKSVCHYKNTTSVRTLSKYPHVLYRERSERGLKRERSERKCERSEHERQNYWQSCRFML